MVVATCICRGISCLLYLHIAMDTPFHAIPIDNTPSIYTVNAS